MALKLTPHVLQQAYELLSATEPFNRWNLPSGEDVEFRVIKTKEFDAQLVTQARKKPRIEISTGRNGHIETVLSSMAHEMIHLHEYRCKIRGHGPNHHGAAFRKWAAKVCMSHGYDLKLFF